MYGRIDRECRGRRITDQVNGRSAGSHLRGIVFFGSFLGDFEQPSEEFELGVYDLLYFCFNLSVCGTYRMVPAMKIALITL